MRVLLIDDHVPYLTACTAVLAEADHEIVPCASFHEGRRRLAHDTFDAVIADVRLGAYNGLHLITLATPSTMKIAISAFEDPVLRQDAEQVGARFLVKTRRLRSVICVAGSAPDPQSTAARTGRAGKRLASARHSSCASRAHIASKW